MAGKVVHDDDPISTDQVNAAVPRETDGGWRLGKGKSERKIDSAIALCMAVNRATTRPPAEEEELFVGVAFVGGDDGKLLASWER